MNDLQVTIIQSDIQWEDRAANLRHIDTLVKDVKPGSHLIVLPEMFTTGFSMEPKRIAEHHEISGMETLDRMRAWAGQSGAIITGSVSVEEGGKFYNRLYWMRPDGTFNQYNKRHLFQMAGEHHQYTQGGQVIIEEINGWKICPLICYDLRFPVWSRNRLVVGKPLYDVLIYVANWPELRREPWKKLLLARAIENQCYVAGANRIGVDAGGLFHTGDSSVINPRGEYIIELNPGMEDVQTVSLEWEALEVFRNKFPVLGDADDFNIIP